MAEIISCPACGRKLQVPESYYGQTVQCPECKHMFQANPHGEGVQSAPPPTPPPSVSTSAPPRSEERRRNRDDDDEDDFDDYRDPLARRRQAPHRGGTILALGIIALVLMPCSTVICGPMAWVMGNTDMAEIRAGRMDPAGEGMVQAGRILGMISSGLLVLILAFYCLIGAAMFAGGLR